MITYIDTIETLHTYRDLLIKKVKDCRGNVSSLETSLSNLLTPKKILLHINSTCDSLAANMEAFDDSLDQIATIRQYLKKHDIPDANLILETYNDAVNRLLDVKARLFNNPVRPVTFNQITRLNELYEVMLVTIDNIFKFNAGPLELAVLFSIEGNANNEYVIGMRNSIRDGILAYIANHPATTHETSIRRIIERLPSCRSDYLIDNLMGQQLSRNNLGIFSGNLLRNCILTHISTFKVEDQARQRGVPQLRIGSR